MATLVRFLKENDGQILAFFPQLNWNRDNKTKVSYAHVGQHSACSIEYAKTLEQSTDYEECKNLIKELKDIGYEPEILNKFEKPLHETTLYKMMLESFKQGLTFAHGQESNESYYRFNTVVNQIPNFAKMAENFEKYK